MGGGLSYYPLTSGAEALMLAELLGKVWQSARDGGRTQTPPIGTPNGIAVLEEVPLNGSPQALLIRGRDVSKPLLLFLHGGPGSAGMWFEHHAMRELEASFVCVNWDQRGAGRSLRSAPAPETLTIAELVADTIALIEHLLARFGHQRLVLVGQSFGSVLALKVAAARPDLLHLVVGVGQVVDMQRGEEISYRYTLDAARHAGDRRAVRQLERLGPPPLYGRAFFTQRRWLAAYRGDTWGLDVLGVIAVGLRAPEYSLMDAVRFFRGARHGHRLLWRELMGVDLATEIPELAVPVVFFAGCHDFTTPFALVEEYYAALRAPLKRLVWFERSAHMPNLEEPLRFQRELAALGAELCR